MSASLYTTLNAFQPKRASGSEQILNTVKTLKEITVYNYIEQVKHFAIKFNKSALHTHTVVASTFYIQAMCSKPSTSRDP